MSLTNLYTCRDVILDWEESAKREHQADRREKRNEKLWFGGALQDLEGNMESLGLPKAAKDFKKNTDKALSSNPVTGSMQAIVDPSSWAADHLKGNLPMMCLRGSISVAAFHEVKHRGIKGVARRYKHKSKFVEPITDYICDVMLPTPLYGPFFILLTRKLNDWVISTTLIKTGIRKPQK